MGGGKDPGALLLVERVGGVALINAGVPAGGQALGAAGHPFATLWG
jgi:hypothetical protein